MNDDNTLLRRYAEERSEIAFAELVQRHVGLVYSAALRRTGGDSHRTADVAQQVFAKLARDAGKLSRHAVLSAWLYTATRNAAINLMRSERRRARREQEAHAMQLTDSQADAPWERVGPVLDAVMDQLGDSDRTALILRFFEQRPFAEIGAALNLTENTARMRTERALDKLRALLARRGVTSTSAALAAALAAQAATAAPAGFAAPLIGAALAGAAGGGAGSALVRSFLAMNKIKAGIAGGVLVAAMVTAIVQLRANRALSAEINALQAENQPKVIMLPGPGAQNPEANELIRLRGRIAQLKARPDGVVDSEMKPRAAWRNAGRATPAAALETLMWASSAHDWDVIGDSYAFSESSKKILDGWFASLSENVREKFGTPERLLAPLLRPLAGTPLDPVVAFQVIDQQEDHEPGVVSIPYWEQLASGDEREAEMGTTKFINTAEGWKKYAGGPKTESEWQKMVFSQIDPATGEPVSKPQ